MASSRRRNVSTVEARGNLSEVLNRAAYGKERVVLARRGRPLAAVVSMEDVAVLEALEDQEDAEDLRVRLAEWKGSGERPIPLAEVAREHGIALQRRKPTKSPRTKSKKK